MARRRGAAVAAAGQRRELVQWHGASAGGPDALAAAYGHALEQYEGELARERALPLEAALRLHPAAAGQRGLLPRQLQRPRARRRAPGPAPLGPDGGEEWKQRLRLFGHVLERAACLRRCKRSLPAFQVPYPPRQLLRDFQAACPTSTCTMLSSRCAPAARSGREERGSLLQQPDRRSLARARVADSGSADPLRPHPAG